MSEAGAGRDGRRGRWRRARAATEPGGIGRGENRARESSAAGSGPKETRLEETEHSVNPTFLTKRH